MAVRRKPGRDGWWVYWREGGRGSKQYWRRFPSKAEAIAFDAKIKREKARRQLESPPVSPAKVSVGALADEFLRWVETYLAKNTLAFYRDRFKALFKIIDRDVLIVNVGLHVEPYIRARRGKVDSGTVNKELKALKRLMSFAVEKRYLSQNPLASLKYLPENKAEKVKKRRIYDRDQVQRFLEHTPKEQRAVFLLFFGMGLRKSEVFSLTWDDIDFENSMLYVVGKGGKLRTLFIPPKILEALRRYPRREGTNYLFPGRHGGPLKDIRGSTWLIMEAAGLHRLTFHEMRHSFASNMLMHGVDPKSIQETLGHSDITITLGLYGHVTKAHLERSMFVSQDIVFPESPSGEGEEKIIPIASARSRRHRVA